MTNTKDNLKLIVDNTEEKKSNWNDNWLASDPKGPNQEDWLSKLPEGTVFACLDKGNKGALLMAWQVAFKYDKSVLLKSLIAGQPPEMLVLTKVFSERVELIEVLTTVENNNNE